MRKEESWLCRRISLFSDRSVSISLMRLFSSLSFFVFFSAIPFHNFACISLKNDKENTISHYVYIGLFSSPLFSFYLVAPMKRLLVVLVLDVPVDVVTVVDTFPFVLSSGSKSSIVAKVSET